MAGKKKKTTTVVEEIPAGETAGIDLEGGETSTFDLDLQRADDAETVDQILKDNGISNVLYRFYDNDGGYCYSSPELDYDRARRETKGGKNCKLGVFIGNKIIRMVPFPLAPIDSTSTPQHTNGNNNGEIGFLKDLLLKLIEKGSSPPSAPAAPTLAELTGALSNLDTLRGKQESAMETFIKGMEFGQGASGQTDWKTDLLRTVRDIAPQVLSGIDKVRGGNVNLPRKPVSEVIIQDTPSQNPDDVPPEIVKAGITYLKTKALAGVEQELLIDWVVNNAEEYEAIIRVVLNKEFSYFVELDSQLATEPYSKWFQSLFNGLRSAFSQPNPMDDDSGGNVGDGGNIRDNGQSSASGGAKPKD